MREEQKYSERATDFELQKMTEKNYTNREKQRKRGSGRCLDRYVDRGEGRETVTNTRNRLRQADRQ